MAAKRLRPRNSTTSNTTGAAKRNTENRRYSLVDLHSHNEIHTNTDMWTHVGGMNCIVGKISRQALRDSGAAIRIVVKSTAYVSAPHKQRYPMTYREAVRGGQRTGRANSSVRVRERTTAERVPAASQGRARMCIGASIPSR